jgi:Ribosomal protein S3, C-terminal domain
MGQKVGGYRRNLPYGKETVRLPERKKETRIPEGTRSWRREVNPEGYVGWNRGSGGTTEKTYGEALSRGRKRRQEVEEVRKSMGGESNGRGRKGNPWTGYVVYGEYTYGERGSENQAGEASGRKKKGKKKRTKPYVEKEFQVGRARVGRKYEARRGGKVERRRKNLKRRRKEKGLEGEKNERIRVLGPGTKRRKAEERCEAVALSGRMPTGQRRTKLRVRELEKGLNHMEVRRGVEALRTHHAKGRVYGRKTREATQGSGGYYGVKVRVKGPLGGARRTRTYVRRKGTVPSGTTKARRRESTEHAKTKIGTLGVKVTYTYGLG